MVISVRGQNFSVQDHSPSGIVQKILTIYRNNGITKTTHAVWDDCNKSWCAKAPERCGGAEDPELKSIYIPSNNTEARPAEYGPKLWAMLDTFGMKGAFDPASWTAAISHISRILNPSLNPDTGCSNCHNEWVDILRESPPSDVTSSKEAARWVFEIHNRVNAKINRPQYVWERAVIKNHWET